LVFARLRKSSPRRKQNLLRNAAALCAFAPLRLCVRTILGLQTL